MIEIVGVQFETGGKVYYFSPNGQEFHKGDGVIVETAKGTEYGVVGVKNSEVEEKDITGELKPVVRPATEEDKVRVSENLEKNRDAMRVFKEKIEAHALKMKPVAANYTFDRNKVIFNFTAESRVDFRELVRDLAGALRTRIELRQIYEKDDFKFRATVASCGRICCCANHLAEEAGKSTIKMAKTQGLSLSSSKISGICGKLMCCLRYENDFYADVLKRMPKIKSRVETPRGVGTVEAQNMLKESVRVRVETPEGGLEVGDYLLSEIKSATSQN